jgi:hypothetical protein
MPDEPADLTTLDGLDRGLRSVVWLDAGSTKGTPDGTYCPGCGAERRMHIRPLTRQFQVLDARLLGGLKDQHLPAALVLTCVQCSSTIVVVIYDGPGGPAVVALPSTYGGLTTLHTPEAVAYYLDQAQRAQSIGALSASVAMYRAALEQLLYDQGRHERMLAAKIDALLEDDDPPKWLRDLDPDYLTVIKDLGNAAIHPNDGDISRQQALDAALVLAVRELFVELLDDIYERPGKKASRLAAMREAAESFQRAKIPPGDQGEPESGRRSVDRADTET